MQSGLDSISSEILYCGIEFDSKEECQITCLDVLNMAEIIFQRLCHFWHDKHYHIST